MANYKGRVFLLKVGTWAGGVTVGDCREHGLTLNNELVDITNKSSNGYRTFLEGAGTKSIDITVSGVITSDAGFETLQGYALADSINAMAMQWADGDTLEGSFAIENFQVSGSYNNEQNFSMTLKSSGSWTFTPA